MLKFSSVPELQALNCRSARDSSACMKAQAKKSAANHHKEHTVEKYIQWVTMLSLTIRVGLSSFVYRCCFPKVRNPAKFYENSNLEHFKLIQGHQPWC